MWCTTECWDCEDKKCEHYISKSELYFENKRLEDQLQQKENKEKEIREYIEKASYLQGNKILEEKELLKILDKESQ